MTLEKLLTRLGYEGSPCFLRRDDGKFESEPSYGHIFRKALDRKQPKAPRWRVEGVYGVRDLETKAHRFLPVVYVCTADDAAAAQELHRLVWNQDVVPYVLVLTQKGVIAYSGYRYSAEAKTEEKRGILAALTDFNDAQEIIDLFHAREVDSGQIWKQPRLRVDTAQRVYHELLKTLRHLDTDLQSSGLSKEVSHALIGKYVYLRYLRDRGILSDERLTIWDLKESDIFGNKAKKGSLEKLTDHLDNWLNGEVFPLPWRGPASPSPSQVQAVAGAFHGDESHSSGTQLQLDLQPYDFSYIPIETLSLVYEQFLHIEKKKPNEESKAGDKPTKGRTEGAYYTPLPLVNFMLAEMEQRRPLKKGMKVFDPSCGSGAFLVQAFRLLIEKTFPNQRPKPTELKVLLESSIFGCDVDGDACQVTQLSLLLTLLDYVDPPDLTGSMHAFKLPTLGQSTDPRKIAEGHTPNILKGNFFGIEPALRAALSKKNAKFDWRAHGFDWVVGNPPWKPISPKKLGVNDSPVWDWMKSQEKIHPVGLNQAAQAFAWEAPRYLKADGECTLLVPAMGLFEEPSSEFRKAFFSIYQVHNVANFANLAEVLFDGRARVPAAAISYRVRPDGEAPEPDEAITVFSPFVVNQEPTCPAKEGERTKIWSLVINGSEIQTVEQREVAKGSGLPWKLAMWGSPWDDQLLKRLERKWSSLAKIQAKWDRKKETFVQLDTSQILGISQGLELREKKGEDTEESPLIEVSGAKALETDALDRLRHIFKLPESATPRLAKKEWFARKGRTQLPLAVCRPPHVIVSAACNFAIYSDEFIVIPPRQIGLISCSKDKDFLKALSLFLSSDFAFYHQFFRSTQLGVQRGRATLESLRKMPIPLVHLSSSDLREWVDLHSNLVICAPRRLDEGKKRSKHPDLFEATESDLDALLKQLNQMTYDVLGLDEQERALIHDLVHVRYALNDGKRGDAAMRNPKPEELLAYAKSLKLELDDFTGTDAGRQHRVTVVTDGESAMVEIDFTQDLKAAKNPKVLPANGEEAAALRKTKSKVLREKAQWVYFNRNLRVYRDRKTYVFKPLNRFHWTQSSALTDASEIIAETLGGASD